MRGHTPAVEMRAPFGPAAFAVLLIYPATLVLGYYDATGYRAEEPHLTDTIDVIDSSTAQCPTNLVLRSRQTCRVDGVDAQCVRLHCCDSHTHIAGRCIPKSMEPCNLNLCEQACEARGESIWCSCYPGYQFNADTYAKQQQPYCIDVDECATDNGGCEQQCINDPGSFHCQCSPPLSVASDGKKCVPRIPIAIAEPLPLVRASSRCYAPCDTVTWLTRKVRQLNDQLHSTHAALKKLSEHPKLKNEDDDKMNEDNAYRVLDATAPLEGGYCRCERGPRGPQGPPGMEGPKGDVGARGPRGQRGPKGSLDLMLLMLADVRHDIQNIEARVYRDGEKPERFNLQKAWRRQRKQEKIDRDSRTEQELEAYTATSVDNTIEITSRGRTGEIPHDSTTDFSMVKGDDDDDLPLGLMDDMKALERLRKYHAHINGNTSKVDDEESDNDYEYSFY